MGGPMSKDQAHEASIKLSLKRAKPYEVIAKHSFGMTKKKRWMIIYKQSDGPKPVVILDDIKSAKKARKWLRLLERAWAEGFFYSSWR